MSESGLERALEQLSDGGGPREGWQDCVRARLEVLPPARPRRARWPLAAAGSGLVAAAAAVVLFVALRSPERRPAAAPAPDRAALDRLTRDIEQRVAAEERAYVHLLRAVTEAEKVEAEQALRKARMQLEAVEKSLKALTREVKKNGRAWPRLDDGKLTVKCDPNDPLCGID